ncbi:hypothetical protein [Sphingomonas sp. ERG5]|uniref:hypothetical protein n=1 Tax=Sphingomonas sp. ERG5 TaxID=1381597 RepID=UPI00054B8A0E|nr:hypothetical protein [Sphingomonas sp. ERG5]
MPERGASNNGFTPNAPAIMAAIAAADHARNGVDFGPFLINVMMTNAGQIWSSEKGDYPISFLFDEYGLDDGGFHSLGGAVLTQATETTASRWSIYAKPHAGAQTGLVQPASFDWVLDDAGSGNPNSVDYFWPTPPAGCQGVGICFAPGAGPDGFTPPTSWCVASTSLEPGLTTPFWSDAGQGWSHHSGNLSAVSLTDTPPGDKIRIAPRTYLSDEAVASGKFGSSGWTLVGEKMMLPVPGSGSTLPPPTFPAPGSLPPTVLHAVAILPGHAIVDPDPYQASAFYYLSAESSWSFGSAPDPANPTYQIYYEQLTQADLRAVAGLAIGAKSGVVIPPTANGLLSIDLNAEFWLRNNVGPTDDTVTLPLPPAVRVGAMQYWQRTVTLTLWRCDGSVAAGANYFAASVRPVVR